jgi:hypothetical protein
MSPINNPIVNPSYRETKQKHNTICIGYLYAQANTNKVNKTWALLQLEVKMNRTSFVCGNHHGHHKRTQNVNTHNRTTQNTKNLSNTDTIIKPYFVRSFICVLEYRYFVRFYDFSIMYEIMVTLLLYCFLVRNIFFSIYFKRFVYDYK